MISKAPSGSETMTLGCALVSKCRKQDMGLTQCTYFTGLLRHRPVCGAGSHGSPTKSFAAVSCEGPGQAAGTVRLGGGHVGFVSEMEQVGGLGGTMNWRE